MKKGLNNHYILLVIFLLLAIIFKDKYIYLAPNLEVSISIIIYSITFLIPILSFNRYKSKSTKNSITSSAICIIIFYLLVTLLCTINGNIDSALIDNTLREVFTPNKIAVFNIIVYYPDLIILGILAIFVLTHYILISVNDALTSYTNIYVSFAIAIFIAFIIDTIFMVTLMNSRDIYLGNLEIIDIIKKLTASFMMVICTSLTMIFIYPFITSKKQTEEKSIY